MENESLLWNRLDNAVSSCLFCALFISLPVSITLLLLPEIVLPNAVLLRNPLTQGSLSGGSG